MEQNRLSQENTNYHTDEGKNDFICKMHSNSKLHDMEFNDKKSVVDKMLSVLIFLMVK
jgi:hypothetical protein